jgi:hypothetical protein
MSSLYVCERQAMTGATDPLGHRKRALDAFLAGKVREGFRIETHTDTHAIIVVGGRKSLVNWLRGGRGIRTAGAALAAATWSRSTSTAR